MRQLSEDTKKGLAEIVTSNRISEKELEHVPKKVMDYGHRKPYSEATDCPHLSLRKNQNNKEEKDGKVGKQDRRDIPRL